MKKMLIDHIEQHRDQIVTMMDYIFDNPELGGLEFKAAKLLTDFLEKNGFKIELGIGGFETAFRAMYEQGTGGPSIGLLCEYDALKGMGHACGHHMQGPAIVFAGLALKETLQKDFKLVIYGTPAEETLGGKIAMLKAGCFQDIDVALMMHAAPTTTTDVRSLASSNYTVNFHGVSAHAALKPEEGRSALDGVLLLTQGIEFLREHVRDDVRIHYVITNGGVVANVVPQFASIDFSLRSYDRTYLDEVVERFKKIVEGAALMTETRSEVRLIKSYNNKIPVYALNNLLMENAKQLNAPTIRPPRMKTGSTDFGDVMYQLPGSCIRVAFVPEGSSSHSEIYLEQGKSANAHEAAVVAAKILAASSYDLIVNEDLLAEVKREFKLNKAQGHQ